MVSDDGKIVALVYPDFELARQQSLGNADIERIMNDNIVNLNQELPSYSQVAGVKIYTEEFEKTPKRSIKRYLYQRG